MRRLLRRRLFAPVLLASVTACGGGSTGPQGDGGSVDRQSRPRLRASLGIDLADVASFAVLSGSASGFASSGTPSFEKANDGGILDAAIADAGNVTEQAGLFALTLAGDTVPVNLVEEGNPDAQSGLQQPPISDIYPTKSWVLFTTQGYMVNRAASDGGVDSVACSTIAARRADGALFCGPLAGRPTSHGLDHSLQTNAAGDVVYLAGGDPASQSERVYKLTLSGADGPTVQPITPLGAMPWWFFANADGDLLQSYSPSLIDPSVVSLDVVPVDGSPTIPFGSRPAGLATRGAAGDPDANTFYVTVGGSNGIGFMGSIRVIAKQGTSFVETEVTPNLANLTSYGLVLHLSDGVYLFSPYEKALARIFTAGTYIPNPTPVPIVGVDSFLNVQGLMITPSGGQAVFLASTPTGLQFIRHDGATQQNIPIPSDLTLTRVIYAQSGAIDFIALRTSTLETVRGSVEPSATTVTVNTTGTIQPDRIVVFTRIQ